MFCLKLRFIFVAIVVTTSVSKGCHACFQEDDYVQSPTLPVGSSFYQECHCSEPGYSVSNLKWVDNNNKMITAGPGTDSNVYIEHQSDSINLHIVKIGKTMSGTYKCITEYEGKEYVQTYNVDAYDPVYFFNTPEIQHLLEGHGSRINCEAKGESTPMYSWQKNNNEQVQLKDDERYQITTQGLIIKNVTKDDAGIYSCTALVISTGEELSKFIEVEVMTLPTIKELKAVPENILVEGESLIIECIAESFPFPEYSWNKILETEQEETNNHTWRQDGYTIVFDEVRADDRGTYQCQASNLAGNDTKEIIIEVLVPPEITNFENIIAVEGDTVQMICNATGYPVPNITITAKRDEFTEEGYEYLEIQPNSSLVIGQIHEGSYFCNASNEAGTVSKEMNMTVMYKPRFELNEEEIWGWNEKTINFTCLYKSNPPSIIIWRYQGNEISTNEIAPSVSNKLLIEQLNKAPEHYLPVTIDKDFQYGVYECLAENIYGRAIKTTVVKEGFKPPPINNVNKVDVTATSVTFAIEGPDKVDGPNVLGFTAQYDEVSNYNITNIHNNRTWSIDRPYKLDKLRPNTTYSVKFAALNEVGAGPWSTAIEFDTLEKSVPESPTWTMDSIQTSSSNNQVLKWKEPDDNGDPIDYYAVRYCPISDQFEDKLCKEERIEPTTELVLNNLDYNTTYNVELVAHNSMGNSTAANISLTVPAAEEPLSLLSAGTIIGIAVVVVVLCLLLLDLVLLLWRRQGIMATCCCKNSEKEIEENLHARDKKGLLRDNGELADDTLKRPNKGHKEFEYNKNTGIITGKHSSV